MVFKILKEYFLSFQGRIAFYIFLGLQMPLYSHHVGSIIGALLDTGTYNFTILQAVSLALPCGLIGSVITYLILNESYKKENYSKSRTPLAVMLIMVILTGYSFIFANASNVWSWLMESVLIIIVGLSIYFHDAKSNEVLQIDTETIGTNGLYLSSWKEDIHQKIGLTIQIIFILITGAAVAGFAPLYTNNILNPEFNLGIQILLALFVAEIIFFLIGVWIEMIAPWFELLEQIRGWMKSGSS